MEIMEPLSDKKFLHTEFFNKIHLQKFSFGEAIADIKNFDIKQLIVNCLLIQDDLQFASVKMLRYL